MSNSDVRIGVCSVCGMDGRDQTEDLTGADASARSTTGNGVPLEKYKGKLMCPLCVEITKADEESLRDAKKHAEKDKFLGKAGFVNSVS